MTEYICDQQICSNADTLTALLRADLDDVINGNNSILKSLADATQVPAKKWIKTKQYRAGDIVGFGSKIYISKTDNINKNPLNYRQDWYLYQLPYTQDQAKIKAYVLFKTDLTIIKSYNIQLIEEYSNNLFRIYPITAIDPAPMLIPGIVESALDYNFLLDTGTYSNYSYFDVQLKTTDLDQTQILGLVGSSDPAALINNSYICVIAYSTGTTLN